MQEKIKIISTKKIEKFLKEKLENNNFKIYDYNFLEISFKNEKNILLEKKLKNPKNIFIFTSQYAIKSIKHLDIKNIKCFTIKWKTSELAKKYWFEILDTWKNSLDLANSLLEFLPFSQKEGGYKKNLIHLTTENHLKNMEDFLKKKWINLETINVYEKKLNPKKIDFLYDAILFFSPSSIDSFFLKNNLEKKVVVFCIWKTTKKYFLEKKLKNKIIVSKKSTEKSLIDEIFNYYK